MRTRSGAAYTVSGSEGAVPVPVRQVQRPRLRRRTRDDAVTRSGASRTHVLRESATRRQTSVELRPPTRPAVTHAATQTTLPVAAPAAVPAPRRRWKRRLLRALEVLGSGVSLNAAFFYANPGNRAADLCSKYGQFLPLVEQRNTSAQCAPQYCPGTFAWFDFSESASYYKCIGLEYYKGLGVDAKASHRDVRSACKRAKVRWHPDRTVRQGLAAEEAKNMIIVVNEACEVLLDEGLRREYDAERENYFKIRRYRSGYL